MVVNREYLEQKRIKEQGGSYKKQVSIIANQPHRQKSLQARADSLDWISVISSEGILLIDRSGCVRECNVYFAEPKSEGEFSLSDISQFNMTEYCGFWGLNINEVTTIDILDLGYWYRNKKDGLRCYESPDADFRAEAIKERSLQPFLQKLSTGEPSVTGYELRMLYFDAPRRAWCLRSPVSVNPTWTSLAISFNSPSKARQALAAEAFQNDSVSESVKKNIWIVITTSVAMEGRVKITEFQRTTSP